MCHNPVDMAMSPQNGEVGIGFQEVENGHPAFIGRHRSKVAIIFLVYRLSQFYALRPHLEVDEPANSEDRQLALTGLFGANLALISARKARNLTQAELAERVGMSTEMISKIERGIAAPSFPTIGKLGDVLGVPDVVFFGVGLVAVSDSERSRILQKIHGHALAHEYRQAGARAGNTLAALVD